MRDRHEFITTSSLKPRGKKKTDASREEVVMEMRGAYCRGREAHDVWKIGRISLTNNRLVLRHLNFPKVLFETPLRKIRGLTIEGDGHSSEAERYSLYLLLEDGGTAKLQALGVNTLGKAIRGQLAILAAAGKRQIVPAPLVGAPGR